VHLLLELDVDQVRLRAVRLPVRVVAPVAQQLHAVARLGAGDCAGAAVSMAVSAAAAPSAARRQLRTRPHREVADLAAVAVRHKAALRRCAPRPAER
jgi:hypothetical protein